eukprot:Clim_evm4s201 gene=Clim_evmTU4s201
MADNELLTVEEPDHQPSGAEDEASDFEDAEGQVLDKARSNEDIATGKLDGVEGEYEDLDHIVDGVIQSPLSLAGEFGIKTIRPSEKAPTWYKGRDRRSRTEAPQQKNSLSIVSILKSFVGQDLSRIAMPVNFNEPLSFLQRLTEDMEYSDILDKAMVCEDPELRAAYVGAFAASTYAATLDRLCKPFNPLLGETFELIHPEKGYALVCEQVSHHPPISALHCESDRWIFYQDYRMESKFRGQYLTIIPVGQANLIDKERNEKFTWNKPVTTIHSILVGWKIWVDHQGPIDVINHTRKSKCRVLFRSYQDAGNHYYRLIGVSRDSNGNPIYKMTGAWNDGLAAHLDEQAMMAGDLPEYRVKGNIPLWKTHPRPKHSEAHWGMTAFAMALNQESPGCAPTDCRYRPDQKMFETGMVDPASAEKLRLEEKQRTTRRVMEERKERWKPRWFTEIADPDTKKTMFVYTGKYWQAREAQDWEECPDIF